MGGVIGMRATGHFIGLMREGQLAQIA